MKLHHLIILLLTTTLISCNQTAEKEAEGIPLLKLRYEENETVTYYEAIEMYQKLDKHYPQAKLLSYGKTDAGKPLHLFVMSADGKFDAASAKKTGKSVVLINNGIHPGEPEGIDASLQFADDLLRNKDGMAAWLKNTVICIIPVYNIDGCLNRSAYHRTGQTTPKECGYRGNAKNLDLNRDFVKMETGNARAFATIFREWNPDVFLDTHTTNGSEHQYVITLIPYQDCSLPEPLGRFFRNQMIPEMYKQMATTPYELIPYVNYINESPKQGISLDYQPPKFSTGYTGLYNTLGFMVENQIYAPFPDRVKSVYYFMKFMTEFTHNHSDSIIQLRKEAREATIRQKEYVIGWKSDTARFETIRFKGYEAEMGISPVTGLERFGFNLNKPYDTVVPYFDRFVPVKTAKAPMYYILPQAWDEVVEKMQTNHVKMLKLAKDTSLMVERYYITNYKTSEYSYNWHRYHTEVQVSPKMEKVDFYEGDYVIPMNQEANRYIVEMLEPEAEDSFFRWNFFDPCLESREYYSSYGFEANAQKYLDEHPDFKKQYEEACKTDPKLANSHRARLGYIYNNTEWADKNVGRYPVVRVNEEMRMPVMGK